MAITASQARAQLFPLIEQVNEDMKPVVITSKAGNAVLISESEYESMIETAYLLSTPAIANGCWILWHRQIEASSFHWNFLLSCRQKRGL